MVDQNHVSARHTYVGYWSARGIRPRAYADFLNGKLSAPAQAIVVIGLLVERVREGAVLVAVRNSGQAHGVPVAPVGVGCRAADRPAHLFKDQYVALMEVGVRGRQEWPLLRREGGSTARRPRCRSATGCAWRRAGPRAEAVACNSGSTGSNHSASASRAFRSSRPPGMIREAGRARRSRTGAIPGRSSCPPPPGRAARCARCSRRACDSRRASRGAGWTCGAAPSQGRLRGHGVLPVTQVVAHIGDEFHQGDAQVGGGAVLPFRHQQGHPVEDHTAEAGEILRQVVDLRLLRWSAETHVPLPAVEFGGAIDPEGEGHG